MKWVILIICLIIYMMLDPFIDCYRDSNKKLHIVIWYDSLYGNRKHLIILGGQI